MIERISSRPQTAGRSRQHGDQQRQDHADLGSQYGVDNVGGSLISQLFIGHDELIELFAAGEPDRVYIAIELGACASVVASIILGVNLGKHARISLAALLENCEAVSVFISEDRLLVAIHLCLQVFVKALKLVFFLLGQRTPLPFGNQLQRADVTFTPRAAHQRAVVNTGQRIETDIFLAGLDGQQS